MAIAIKSDYLPFLKHNLAKLNENSFFNN